jgi:hypothetical protein
MALEEEMDPGEYLARQLGTKTLQDINLILLEGLFFYRKDDALLFSRMSERQAAFRQFWDRYFGLDLIIEQNVAYRRVRHEGEEVDSGFRNPAIPPSSRALFQWTGSGRRERALVFMLFLQFYEGDLRSREDAGHGERLFYHHEFYRFVQDNYTRWFAEKPEDRPADHELFGAVGDVLDTMLRFRFVEKDKTDDITDEFRPQLPRGYTSDRVFMYRALDGLRGYRPHTLTQTIALRAYALDENAAGQEDRTDGEE